MSNPNRKDENIRRANRVIQTRSFVLMLLMGVGMFVLLFFQLFDLQIVRHEELQSKAVSQQTRRTVVTASRGTIYDRTGNIMAISASAETIILSPLEIDRAVNDKDAPVSWTKDTLAAGLAELLDGDAAAIRKRMDNTKSQYEVIKLRAEEDTANAVRAYINENKIVGVHLVADAKRYYPYGSLASHVIGFVGDDNTGLYGLEARYEQELEGQSGLVVSTKDNAGNDMMYAYEQYFAAQNGSDLTLTLDTTIQYYLEKGLDTMTDKFAAANGATGIIMDVKTGGILAMASSPSYDLNDFAAVQDKTLQERMERGESTLAEMQLLQWRNKALNDTYEPGSTFKILTLAAALEEGVIDKNTTVNCNGYVNISNYTIHCSNKAGHGLQTLVQSVGNSCNPAFISYGLKLGNTKFYDYMRSFGLMDGTGIDLGGEATGIFADPSSFTQLDLACYSFGQNFNVTPLSLITAQAACVNGGYLHSPYLVERITDSNGSVTYQHDSTPVRQVISEETSAAVRECLEYVVAHGISSMVEGKKVIIGSAHFVFEDEGCRIPAGEQPKFDALPAAYSHLYLCMDGELAAVICIHDPLRREARETVRALHESGFANVVMMTGDNRRTAEAVAKGEFEPYFQFVVDRGGTIIGAETVSRWQSPEDGLLPPSKYIDLMIRAGTVTEHDLYMLRCACAQLQSWRREGLEKLCLSCNFTRQSLSDERTLPRAREIAEQYDFSHDCLIIEITEDCLVHDRSAAAETLNGLIALGFHIALDDMGAG